MREKRARESLSCAKPLRPPVEESGSRARRWVAAARCKNQSDVLLMTVGEMMLAACITSRRASIMRKYRFLFKLGTLLAQQGGRETAF